MVQLITRPKDHSKCPDCGWIRYLGVRNLEDYFISCIKCCKTSGGYWICYFYPFKTETVFELGADIRPRWSCSTCMLKLHWSLHVPARTTFIDMFLLAWPVHACIELYRKMNLLHVQRTSELCTTIELLCLPPFFSVIILTNLIQIATMFAYKRLPWKLTSCKTNFANYSPCEVLFNPSVIKFIRIVSFKMALDVLLSTFFNAQYRNINCTKCSKMNCVRS